MLDIRLIIGGALRAVGLLVLGTLAMCIIIVSLRLGDHIGWPAVLSPLVVLVLIIDFVAGYRVASKATDAELLHAGLVGGLFGLLLFGILAVIIVGAACVYSMIMHYTPDLTASLGYTFLFCIAQTLPALLGGWSASGRHPFS